MDYLIDTNILLRISDRNHSQYQLVRTAVSTVRQRGHGLVVAMQNFVEFWNVATRPSARNGFGLTPAEAEQRLVVLEQLFHLLPERSELYSEWRRIIVAFGVSGVQVHDARLVALMKLNDITHILTLNAADFHRYAVEGIIAAEPASI